MVKLASPAKTASILGGCMDFWRVRDVFFGIKHRTWMWPPPRIPVANEGLGWDSLLKMVHNPGGHCYWEGATSNIEHRNETLFKNPLGKVVVWDVSCGGFGMYPFKNVWFMSLFKKIYILLTVNNWLINRDPDFMAFYNPHITGLFSSPTANFTRGPWLLLI